MPLSSVLQTPIEYLKGVGPQRADLLRKELNISTFDDLLNHFPFRYVDKTRVFPISAITPQMDTVQVRGRLIELEESGMQKARRLNGVLEDETGTLDLSWFQGIVWAKKGLVKGGEYVVFGKVTKGLELVTAIEKLGTDSGKPKAKVVIADCGQL